MSKIKVLVIDDSALTRAVLTKILNKDPEIIVVGTAADPLIAEKKIKQLHPNVITLDLEMPRMDGLTFLQKLRRKDPIPTIVISGNSPRSSNNAIKSLEYGAIDIIEKPDISTPEKLEDVSHSIHESVKAAFAARKVSFNASAENRISEPINSIKEFPIDKSKPAKKVVLIGASTGGPDTIKFIISKIKKKVGAYVIAQHMPAMFTKSFADRLNLFTELIVTEATHRDILEDGRVYVIPGDHHGVISKGLSGYFISLNKGDKVNRHRPSVDVLFKSGKSVPKPDLTAILLTGMGDDGAKGLKLLHEYGVTTIAQHGPSCIVFGMPKRAIELGAADKVLTPNQIVDIINKDK